ncbi:DUF6526 family protein [Daejeonella sp.]|uniref:DUF6526 family protein n=1 Tax=Daejeonella sp. TaxID=2805397 RepID=UPI0030C51C20
MEQNFQNHARLVVGFHGVLLVLLLAGLIGSGVNLYESIYSSNLYSASLIVLLFVCSAIMYAYVRLFPLRAQDRSIRAEENFRYYILTGKPLPSELRISQIIALRFAPDEEFPDLTIRALKEKLKPKEIKQAIQKWKADHHRV